MAKKEKKERMKDKNEQLPHLVAEACGALSDFPFNAARHAAKEYALGGGDDDTPKLPGGSDKGSIETEARETFVEPETGIPKLDCDKDVGYELGCHGVAEDKVNEEETMEKNRN